MDLPGTNFDRREDLVAVACPAFPDRRISFAVNANREFAVSVGGFLRDLELCFQQVRGKIAIFAVLGRVTGKNSLLPGGAG